MTQNFLDAITPVLPKLDGGATAIPTTLYLDLYGAEIERLTAPSHLRKRIRAHFFDRVNGLVNLTYLPPQLLNNWNLLHSIVTLTEFWYDESTDEANDYEEVLTSVYGLHNRLITHFREDGYQKILDDTTNMIMQDQGVTLHENNDWQKLIGVIAGTLRAACMLRYAGEINTTLQGSELLTAERVAYATRCFTVLADVLIDHPAEAYLSSLVNDIEA